MNTIEAHFLQWRRNKGLADAMLQTPAEGDVSWSIVLYFYAALHLTQAYLSSKGEAFEASDHSSRKRAIQASPELKRQHSPAYQHLRRLSELVRYQPTFEADKSHIEAAKATLHLVESILLGKISRWLAENS